MFNGSYVTVYQTTKWFVTEQNPLNSFKEQNHIIYAFLKMITPLNSFKGTNILIIINYNYKKKKKKNILIILCTYFGQQLYSLILCIVSLRPSKYLEIKMSV